MNSLIGLGAATSFLAGGASLAVPGVGLQPGFLEEPVMLLAIVLLGRNLEASARLTASGGAHLLPSPSSPRTPADCSDLHGYPAARLAAAQLMTAGSGRKLYTFMFSAPAMSARRQCIFRPPLLPFAEW